MCGIKMWFCKLLLIHDVFFFFQAEDGIRDADVTGVQTCALPISAADEVLALAMGRHARKVPMIVENGTADVLNPVVQSENLVRSWLGAMDFADDGKIGRASCRERV